MCFKCDRTTVVKPNLERALHRRPLLKLLQLLCALTVWIAHILCPMLRTVNDHTLVPMASGGFCVTSGVLFVGHLLGRACPVLLESIWSLTAFVLFLCSTATIMDSLSHDDEGTTKMLIVFKGCAAAITSLVYLLDFLLDLSVMNEPTSRPATSFA